VLSVDYVAAHTVKINRLPTKSIRAGGQLHAAILGRVVRTNDVSSEAATNPQPPYGLIQSDVNKWMRPLQHLGR